MSMKEWAKREVEFACKRENPNRKEGEFDYGCACYESALKAFNCLTEDGHSGFSIGITKHILNRLIDGKPLTPIEDTEDVWKYSFDKEDGIKVYQCKRMSSFFKSVYPDGKVEYSDVNRSYCINLSNPNASYHNGLVTRVINEIYPIKMPYIPLDKEIKVVCEEFLTDRRNGDFDTIGVLYCITTEGKRKINRFFKEGEKGFIEINKEEYEERRKIDVKAKNADNEEDSGARS